MRGAGVSKGPYLDFTEVAVPPGRKTPVWEIRSKTNGNFLGHVAWYGPWRRFVYAPFDETVKLDATCLSEIVTFIVAEMEKRSVG